ncbi:MAG: alpha/beta fold hydrolase, partial [Verrucomicrobia bacterium]|nr:alpha/beta fold hydrolase [Verrucomicrobiota bacterium]
GLGGDISQPLAILGSSTCLRTLAFDCRGHGQTEPLGPTELLTFSAFADDLHSILDALRIDRPVVGGISMGAGVALNFALRYPARVQALILSRPAWLDAPCPSNLEILRILSSLLKEWGTRTARELLLAHPAFQRVKEISRDNATSILRQFERPNVEATIATLANLPADAPCSMPEAWATISVPTLVIVNELDAMHPAEYGRRLASGIPRAKLVKITPKEKDPVMHTSEAREAIEAFVRTNAP